MGSCNHKIGEKNRRFFLISTFFLTRTIIILSINETRQQCIVLSFNYCAAIVVVIKRINIKKGGERFVLYEYMYVETRG